MITLTAIVELMHDRFEVARVLVIAPKKVAEEMWATEAQKWEHTRHLRIAKVLGSWRERVQALESDADVYVINRENVEWLIDQYNAKFDSPWREWPFDMVVIDELSSFKSNTARRFRALRRVRPLIQRIVGLTGTPAPNGLIDLWPQVYLPDQGERLGKTITGYRDRYFKPGRRDGHIVYEWVPKPESERNIYRKSLYYPTLDRADIERCLTPHATRHTFGTLLDKAKVNTKHIQDLMGHTDYATTANIYTHPHLDELRKAIEAI